MKTRCPNCDTRYNIDPDALLATDGLARCYRCSTVFDAIEEEAKYRDPAAYETVGEALSLDADAEVQAEATDLPFDVPDNLAPLQASPDDALDVVDTLYEKRSYRGVIYGWLAALLIAGLGLQLAWQKREQLLADYPVLEPLCEQLRCLKDTVDEPEQFSVLQREISPADNEPGTLSLKAMVRNDAEAAQELPDIQLSLIDNAGRVLIRRRLSPQNYLFPPPKRDRLIEPGEVITIALDFKDPGHEASGFVIDFL